MAQLNWTDVDSSNVRRVGYHEDTRTLCVEFSNGGLYTYSDVDNEIFVSMVHAESVGRYLNQMVKVMHPYTKFNTHEELLSSFE